MPDAPSDAPPDDRPLDVPVSKSDHILGPPTAPLTLIEYGDYECPDCFNAEPLVRALRTRMGDDLRVVFRHYARSSIHPRASAAAAAAEAAAAQGRFWDMHAALYKNQPRLADLDLTHLALNLGLDVYRFQQAVASEPVARRVRTDFDDAVRNHLTGTPAFFINQHRYRGPIEVDPMLAALGAALERR